MRRFATILLPAICVLLGACDDDVADEPSAGATLAPSPAAAIETTPTISGTPMTATWQGEPYAFGPAANDVDGDALQFTIDNRPSWASFDAATGRLAGTPRDRDVGLYPDIRIRVSDGTATASLAAFDLSVDDVSHGSVTVTWNPPMENTDDSPLQDLVGINVYWGTGTLAKNAVAPNGSTSYLVENLAPGVYQFATTAVNAAGIESELSDLATVVVR